MNDIAIDTEDDPVPIVRILAAQFRRYAHHPDFVDALGALNGVFALKSKKGPQAVTIRVRDNQIRLDRGIAKDAAVVIHTDFTPSDKPNVDGLLRHPLLAMRAGKLLGDYHGSWQDTAKRFWAACTKFPDLPAAMQVTCTDDKAELILGNGEIEAELHGTAAALNEVLSGGTILALALMEGKIRGRYTLEQVARLSEVTKCLMLGDA